MKKRGFTIIEIIISVALISVVMLFLFQLLTDVEFEATHPTYAKENQVVRASVMRSVQQDLTNMPLKSIDSTNKRRIKFTFQDGTNPVDKVLTINDTEISYGNEETWELQGQDVKIDTDNIQVKIVGNDPSLCTDIQNQELQITEQHCPNYQYVKIVIPITNGNEENAIDDIELFYIGEATVFEPDQSLRTYFLRITNDGTSTVNVFRISTSKSEIASTGQIFNGSEIYPEDQLQVYISPNQYYVLDDLGVEGYENFISGGKISVSRDVVIEPKTRLPEYKLRVDEAAGTSIVIERILANGRTEVLKNEDLVRSKDSLKITMQVNPSAYTNTSLKVNGRIHSSGETYIVNVQESPEIVVSSSATVREYTLTKSQGDGTTLTIQRTSSPIGNGIVGVLENNAKIYYNDVLKVTVSAQTGYKDAKIMAGGSELVSGGTKRVTGNLAISSSASYATYSLSYNLDGGSYGASHPTSATYNTAFTVNNPTKTGYSFTGWNITGMDSVTHTYGSSTTTATSINGTKVTSFKNLRASAGTVNFKANWSVNTYTVKWDGNGGTVTKNGATSVSYNNVVGTLGTATRTGYTFAGWFTAASGGTQINANTKVTGDVTYYARWNINDTIKPRIDCNDYRDITSVRSGAITFTNNDFTYSDEGGSGVKDIKYKSTKDNKYYLWPGSITTYESFIQFYIIDNAGNYAYYKCYTGLDNVPPLGPTLDVDRTLNDSNVTSVTCSSNDSSYSNQATYESSSREQNNECTIKVKKNKGFIYYAKLIGDDRNGYKWCFDPVNDCAGFKEVTERIYRSDGTLVKTQVISRSDYSNGTDVFPRYNLFSNHYRILTRYDNLGNASKTLRLNIVYE